MLPCPAFKLILGVQSQVFMLVHKVFYPLSHLPNVVVGFIDSMAAVWGTGSLQLTSKIDHLWNQAHNTEVYTNRR